LDNPEGACISIDVAGAVTWIPATHYDGGPFPSNSQLNRAIEAGALTVYPPGFAPVVRRDVLLDWAEGIAETVSDRKVRDYVADWVARDVSDRDPLVLKLRGTREDAIKAERATTDLDPEEEKGLWG
jgi:hypothetical protein